MATAYFPGSSVHVMDPVSSSMLLTECDPRKSAQVHIVTFIVFDERLSFEAFRDRFVENVILTDTDSRFLYRLDCSNLTTPARWIKATDWNPEDNFTCISDPQTFESVNRRVSDRLTAGLDVRKPVWELQFLETYSDGTSSQPVSAAIITMHHSMGDGFTLCHQIMRRAAPADASLTMHDCYPFHTPATERQRISLRRTLSNIVKLVKSILKLLFLSPDPPSSLRSTTSRGINEPIVSDMAIMSSSVEKLKKIAHKATWALSKEVRGRMYLNDVVVAACSLALGNLMKENRQDVTSAIWIGLNRKSVIDRPKHRRFDWGNENLGTCYLKLPTGETDPVEVLIQAHKRLAEMKTSPEPLVANRLLAFLGSIPLWILWPFRNVLMDKMSASISNFPGPIKKIRIPVTPDNGVNQTLEGVGTVRDAFFVVAPPFKYGPYVTILSYCGRMYLALSAAEKLMPQSVVEDLVRRKIDEAVDLIDKSIDNKM